MQFLRSRPGALVAVGLVVVVAVVVAAIALTRSPATVASPSPSASAATPTASATADREPLARRRLPDERDRGQRSQAGDAHADPRPDREQPDRAAAIRPQPGRPRHRGAGRGRHDALRGGLHVPLDDRHAGRPGALGALLQHRLLAADPRRDVPLRRRLEGAGALRRVRHPVRQRPDHRLELLRPRRPLAGTAQRVLRRRRGPPRAGGGKAHGPDRPGGDGPCAVRLRRRAADAGREAGRHHRSPDVDRSGSSAGSGMPARASGCGPMPALRTPTRSTASASARLP